MTLEPPPNYRIVGTGGVDWVDYRWLHKCPKTGIVRRSKTHDTVEDATNDAWRHHEEEKSP